MSLMELLEKKEIDPNDKEKIAELQEFYQEGYFQGVTDKNPNYDYSIKYQEQVQRLCRLFELTFDPVHLEYLRLCLDNLDEFRKKNLI